MPHPEENSASTPESAASTPDATSHDEDGNFTIFPPPRVPFIVGVTGHMKMDPEDAKEVEKKVEQVLRWLRDGDWPDDTDECCQEPLGLSKETPIVVLSSLAPGADQLVADAALELGCQVRCPLPFPPEFYKNASTFRQGGKDANKKTTLVYDQDAGRQMASGKALLPHEREDGLPVPTEADRSRQADYTAIVRKIGSRNTFFVYREEDISLSDDDLQEQLAADLRDRTRRNLRYRAAGEYVSAYSDILIAICEQRDVDADLGLQEGLSPLAQPGARLIADSHLNGLEPGILPLGTSLTWADNGPVVRIYCPNARTRTSSPPDHSPDHESPPVGHVAMWHPRDSAVPEQFEPDWHRREMRLLREFASRIDKFNSDAAALETSKSLTPLSTSESGYMLRKKSSFRPRTTLAAALSGVRNGLKKWFKRSQNLRDPGAPVSPDLEAIARLRRVAARVNRHLWDPQVKNLITSLFLLTALVVVFGQAYENFVLEPHEEEVPPWRIACFWTAVSLFLVALGLHRWKRSRDIFDRQNDSRALAEGLRVQYYWAAAGLGLSAASHYLQQVKGGTSWIRAGIASPAFPYEAGMRKFRAFSPREKHDRLSAICDGWLGEQNAYYAERSHTMSRTKHRIHRTANVFLIAGFALILLNFTQHAVPDSAAAEWLRSVATRSAWNHLAWWAATVATGWLLVQLATEMAYRGYYDTKRRTAWVAVSRFLHRFADGPPLWMILWLLGVSLGWAVFSGLVSWSIERLGHSSPPLNAIAKNVLLAAGGLLHTFAAVKFLTENTRRYSAMRNLFRASETRLRRLLDDYDQAMANVPVDPAEQQRLLDAIHAQLAALGAESLHENTDWLLMHRDKPVEPVLPVG